jgi:predicted KAP-like P-loop ATPase
MNISTFDDDLLGLKDFSQRLDKFISTEQEFVEGSLVISLTSKFGSGKTTFLQMWKDSLESDEGDNEKPLVISLNAWESDYYGDPLFAIISGMVECIEKKGNSADTLVDAAKDVGAFATAIGSQVVAKFTGIDPVAAGETAKKKKAARKASTQVAPDIFSIYQGRRDAMKSLKDAIQEFVSVSTSQVLFLVDELDRCRPDYAISYLETIKHIFDVKGAVFLLAADREHLEKSAKTAFGLELDFDEYYRRFVHREVPLPPIVDSGYEKLVLRYVQYYLE